MREGDYLTWNSNNKLLLYYVENIIFEEGIEEGRTAALSVKRFAEHIGRKELEKELDNLLLSNSDKEGVLNDEW